MYDNCIHRHDIYLFFQDGIWICVHLDLLDKSDFIRDSVCRTSFNICNFAKKLFIKRVISLRQSDNYLLRKLLHENLGRLSFHKPMVAMILNYRYYIG